MVDENDDLDLEQYEAVYEFQQNQLEQAKSQSIRLDDKASKYLTFTALIITAVGIFAKEYFFDSQISDHSFLFYLIIIFIALSVLSLMCISRFLFICLKVNEVEKLSSKIAMVEYWLDYPRTTIYYELSKQLSGIIDKYDLANSTKVENLNKAFEEIKTCGLLLLVSVILIVLDLALK
ncbi:hypothetical protein ACT4ZA_12345 [Acinetobacter baumannii]